jgi:hypothetical protein
LEKKRAKQVLLGSRGGGGSTIYIHISKCKNDKRRKEKNPTTLQTII